MAGLANSEESPGTVRVVHFTDVHIQRERKAFERVKEALDRVASLNPKVDALLLGGDTVMNSVGVGFDRVTEQWDLWDAAIGGYADMRIVPCIGNQDCWGWNRKASGCTGEEPLFGKKMALRRLAMDRSYYALQIRGWRVVVLDSLQLGGSHGYLPKLDAEQFEWLAGELSTDQVSPTLVMSHVPIVAGPADFFSSRVELPNAKGDWIYPGQHLHADSFALVNLLRRFSNVKVCVAGHIHCAQRIQYRGIWFLHSPAVCGEWWRGDYQGFAPGFTVMDLEPDGTFRSEFVSF